MIYCYPVFYEKKKETRVRIVKAMVFPLVMYGCESWTIKKAEHWRTDAFELCCGGRFLRIAWTARRSSQSILKGIESKYSLMDWCFSLRLQYFGHLVRRASSLEKTLMLGKIKGRRRRGRQRMRWLDDITDSMDISPVAQSYPTLWDPMDCSMPGLPVHHQLLELSLACCSPWGLKESNMAEQLNNNKNQTKIRGLPSKIYLKNYLYT